MKNKYCALALTTLLLTSCSSNKVSKAVISDIHPEAKETLDCLFTIKASNISLAEEDLEARTLASFKKSATGSDIKFELIEVDHLINEAIFKIEPRIENGQSIVKVNYAEDAFNDHAATLNLTRFMDGLLHSYSPALFEIYQSAKNNDPSSLYGVAKIRREVLTPLTPSPEYEPINLSQYNGYIQGEVIFWNKKLSELAKNDPKKNIKKRKIAAVKKEPEEVKEVLTNSN